MSGDMSTFRTLKLSGASLLRCMWTTTSNEL